MLARMFGDGWQSHRDSSGAVLLDRCPRYFAPILSYLRNGRLIVDAGVSLEGVLLEARFFGLAAMAEAVAAAATRESEVCMRARVGSDVHAWRSDA